jgi:Xaa-Pro aminopeptidase
MNVHDVGDYGSKLEPGMVFTNEPGIYIRPEALEYLPLNWKPEDWEKFKTAIRPVFEKYKGIGVRIEDDMLVTPDGVRWMTEALPRKMSEIEEFIGRARQEAR